MATELEATDLRGRIQRLEDWVKTLRWMLAGAGIFLGLANLVFDSPNAFPSGHDPGTQRG